MAHMLEYPQGSRDQQLIQLVLPTLTLQVGHVFFLFNMKEKRQMKTPAFWSSTKKNLKTVNAEMYGGHVN